MNKKLCGYDAENLALFAEACHRAGVTEKDLLAFSKNAQSAYQFGLEEFDNAVRRRLESDLLFGKQEKPI